MLKRGRTRLIGTLALASLGGILCGETLLVSAHGLPLGQADRTSASASPQLAFYAQGRDVGLHSAAGTSDGRVPLYVRKMSRQVAREMGDRSPTSGAAVMATRGAAEWLEGEGVDGPRTPVWFVEMRGTFVDRHAYLPLGAPFPRGTEVNFTVDSRTHETLDFSIGNRAPDLHKLGAVYPISIG